MEAGSLWFCFLFLDWMFLQVRFQIAGTFAGRRGQDLWILTDQWDTQYIYLWRFFNDLFIYFVVAVFIFFGTSKELIGDSQRLCSFVRL